MSRISWLPLSLAAAATFLPLTAGTQATPASKDGSASLTKEWELDLGRGGLNDPDVMFRVAVCADGGLLMTDGLGRFVSIDSDGAIELDHYYSELRYTTAISCGERRRVIAAIRETQSSERSLVFGVRDAAGPYTFSRAPLPVRGWVEAVLPAPDDEFVLMVRNSPGDPFLHRVTLDGQLVASFGRLPFVPDRIVFMEAMTSASLFWLSKGQEIGFAPGTPYVVQRYSRAGVLQRSAGRKDPGFRPLVAHPLTGQPNGDVVRRVVALPSGDFVAQVTREWSEGGAYLEWLGPDMEVKATGLPHFGALLGADSAGALYFSGITRQVGILMKKVRMDTAAP